MDPQAARLQRRLDRERKARKMAEALAEQKSRELYEANLELQLLADGLEREVVGRTAEVRSALGHLSAVLDNLLDGIVAVDTNGKIVVVNPALEGMLGLSSNLRGRGAAEVLPSRLFELMRRAQSADGAMTEEFSFSQNRVVKAVASAIRETSSLRPTESDQTRIGCVALLRDITLEKEIDRMKTDFISTVSHELRTPLTSVLGFSKLIRNKLDGVVFPHVPDDHVKGQRAMTRIRSNIDIILSEGTRLSELINDLLDISKMESGRFEWDMGAVSLPELVERARVATSALFEPDGPVLAVDLDPGLPTLVADADRILQVLINLLSNALKFTPDGEIRVTATARAAHIEISVSDTGVGIEPAMREEVFEKFRQAGDTLTNKPRGTGLGLPICRQIITHHGGRIWIDDEYSQGTRVRLTLPLGQAATTRIESTGLQELMRRVARRVEETPVSTGQKRILVVDDDPRLRELLRQQLEESGFEVREASNGLEAIAEIKRDRPDLVILDVMMPELTGFDVAAMLRNDPATQDLPIIILSIIEDKDRGYRLGVDGYLTKPADPDQLLTEIRTQLSQVRSPSRVLVVDESAPTAAAVQQVLQAKGFQVVASCSGDDCLEMARDVGPDLIVVTSQFAGCNEVIRALRFENGLENIFVLMMVDELEEDTQGGQT